jgi:hypothetical protein
MKKISEPAATSDEPSALESSWLMPVPTLILTKNLDKSNNGVIFREPIRTGFGCVGD